MSQNIASLQKEWLAAAQAVRQKAPAPDVLPVEAMKECSGLELFQKMLRALTDAVGPVRAEGKVIYVGRQIGTAEGRLYDAAGRLYAHATTTCLIFSL